MEDLPSTFSFVIHFNNIYTRDWKQPRISNCLKINFRGNLFVGLEKTLTFRRNLFWRTQRFMPKMLQKSRDRNKKSYNYCSCRALIVIAALFYRASCPTEIKNKKLFERRSPRSGYVKLDFERELNFPNT